MSGVRSALDEWSSIDDGGLSVAELASDVVELGHVIQRAEVLRARKVHHLASRGGHHDLGYSSPTAFLVDQTGVTPSHARRIVSYGNAAQRAPHAYAAWVDGRLSTDQARHLFAAAEAVPDAYPGAEERLVEIVEGLDAVDTAEALAYWRQAVEGPGDLDPLTQQQRRGLSTTWLHGMLPNLTRDWLDNGATPTIGGEKPHVVVHTDVPALQGLAGGLHETENGEIVDVDMLRLIACDCSVTRIILGPESEALDIGRKTRVWTPAQRRAITARDRHCQGPGCRAKPRHCDIHHEDHWADGGTTTVDKGKLFCRPCHVQEHAKDRRRRRRTQG